MVFPFFRKHATSIKVLFLRLRIYKQKIICIIRIFEIPKMWKSNIYF